MHSLAVFLRFGQALIDKLGQISIFVYQLGAVADHAFYTFSFNRGLAFEGLHLNRLELAGDRLSAHAIHSNAPIQHIGRQ